LFFKEGGGKLMISPIKYPMEMEKKNNLNNVFTVLNLDSPWCPWKGTRLEGS
jgi:hypothetical protein